MLKKTIENMLDIFMLCCNYYLFSDWTNQKMLF